VGPGMWRFAEGLTAKQRDEFERLRRERHPLLGPRSNG
jgi:hypothetical protein